MTTPVTIPSAEMLKIAAMALSAGGLTAGAAAYATLYPQSQLCGRLLVASRRMDEIALTFDDGPNPAATPQLLEALAAHKVRATFFLVGENVLREPGLTREIAAAGHVIGNHTMHHPWLTLLSGRRIRAEIWDCNKTLEDTLGTRVGLFRAPHGAKRPVALRTVRELGMTTVAWNVIVRDWLPVEAGTLLRRIEAGVAQNQRRGVASNIVLHDGGFGQPRMPTVKTVRMLLEQTRGAKYVTVDGWV